MYDPVKKAMVKVEVPDALKSVTKKKDPRNIVNHLMTGLRE